MDLKSIAYQIAAKDAAWPVLPLILVKMSTGEIVGASQFAASIFGYGVDDLLGQELESLLIPPDVRDQHRRWRQEAKIPKTRLMGMGRNIRGCRKDGSQFPAYVSLTATEVLGETIGIAFVVDLTGIVETSRLTQQLTEVA